MWWKWFSISLRLVIIMTIVNSIHSGVPGLTKLFRSKFPRAFLPSSQFIKRTEIDHLCIDMNYLLHKCNRVSDNSQFSISYRVLMRFLDSLLISFKPTKSVIFAFDGPASFAKMITQRYRRINEDSSKDYLTPGTDYMNTIEDFMNFYIITKIANKKNLQFPHNITFFLSTPNEQGEGEFKIFDWIHNINHKANNPISNAISILNPTISPNSTSHSTISPKESILICGGDADLIIQSLLCRQPNDIYFYPMDVSVICNITSLRSLSLFETGESILPKKSQFIQQSNELLTVSNHSIQYTIRYPQITSEHQQYDLALFYLFLGNDYVPRLHGSTRQNLLIAYSKLINRLYLEANQTRDIQPPFLLTIPSIHSQSSNKISNQSTSPISFNFTRLKDLFELYTLHLTSLTRRPRSHQKLPDESFSTSAISLLFHLTKNRHITKYEWFQLQYPIFKTTSPSSSLTSSSSSTSATSSASSASSTSPSKRYFLSFLSFPEKKSFIFIPYSSHSYVNSRRFSSYYLLSHMNHKLYQNLITMEHKGKNHSETVISHDNHINELNQFISFSTNFLNSSLPYVYYAVVPRQSIQRKTPVVYRNKAYVPVVKWNYHWNHSDAKVITSLVHSFTQHLHENSNYQLPRNASTNLFATSKYNKLLSHCQQKNISFVLKMRYSELAQTNLSPSLYEYIHTNISHSILKPFLLIDDFSKSTQPNSIAWHNSSDMLLPIMNTTYHNYEILLNNTFISVPAYYFVNDSLGREMISDWILRTYFPYLMTNETNNQLASSSYQTYLQIENKLLEKQLLHITLPIDDFERCSDEQMSENDHDNENNENEGQNEEEIEEERVIETTESYGIDSDVNLPDNDNELITSEEDKFNPLLLLQPNPTLKDITNNNNTSKPTDLITNEDNDNAFPFHNDYYDTLFNVTSKQISFELRDASNQFRTITEQDIVVYLKGLLWIYYIYYHGLCSDQSFCYSNYHAPTTGEIHRYLHNKYEEFVYLQQTNSTKYRSFDEMMQSIIYLPYSTVKPLSPENVCISLIPPKNSQSVPVHLKKIWEGFNNRSHTELDLDCNLEKEYINNTITFNDKRPNFLRLIEKIKELRNQDDSKIFADDHSWLVYSPLHKYSSYHGQHKTLKPFVHIHLPAMKLNSLFKIPKYYRRLRWLSTPIRPYPIPSNQTNT